MDRRRSATAATQPITHVEEAWESHLGPPTPHLSRRKWLKTAGVAIIAENDSGLEDDQNATKPYQIFWDRVEGASRS